MVLVKTDLIAFSRSLTGRLQLPVTHFGRCGIIGFVPASNRLARLADRVATAPLAAAGLIAGFGVAVATDSRPLGGLVLAAFGLTCLGIWLHRDGWRVALRLTVAGLVAFALSHVLGLVIGAWPAVLVVAAGTAGLCWRLSDSRRRATRIRLGAAAGSPRRRLRPDRRGRSA